MQQQAVSAPMRLMKKRAHFSVAAVSMSRPALAWPSFSRADLHSAIEQLPAEAEVVFLAELAMA